jgi:hypothetical protein
LSLNAKLQYEAPMMMFAASKVVLACLFVSRSAVPQLTH